MRDPTHQTTRIARLIAAIAPPQEFTNIHIISYLANTTNPDMLKDG